LARCRAPCSRSARAGGLISNQPRPGGNDQHFRFICWRGICRAQSQWGVRHHDSLCRPLSRDTSRPRHRFGEAIGSRALRDPKSETATLTDEQKNIASGLLILPGLCTEHRLVAQGPFPGSLIENSSSSLSVLMVTSIQREFGHGASCSIYFTGQQPNGARKEFIYFNDDGD